MTENIKTENTISETHYVIIDCGPLTKRPDDILKMILHEDADDVCEDDALVYDYMLTFDDFTLIYATFGEWKYSVFKEKEQLFEAYLPKIIDQLTTLYNCGIIRFAEWSPIEIDN